MIWEVPSIIPSLQRLIMSLPRSSLPYWSVCGELERSIPSCSCNVILLSSLLLKVYPEDLAFLQHVHCTCDFAAACHCLQTLQGYTTRLTASRHFWRSFAAGHSNQG